MKNLVLASVLGSVVGAGVMGGPFHFQVTRPHSFFAVLPATTALTRTVSLGHLPHDFVLTDVVFRSINSVDLYVTVNGVNVMNADASDLTGRAGSTHLNSGVYIPAGSMIGLLAVESGGSVAEQPVTISGYFQ